MTCDKVTFKPEWKSLAPGSHATYRFDETFFNQTRLSPEQMADAMESIRAGFERWTDANAKTANGFSTPLGTNFSEISSGTPTIWVVYEFIQPVGSRIVGGQVAASLPGANFDGILTAAHELKLRFNDAPGALTIPDAFLKTALHEIGHFLGLGENYGTRNGVDWWGTNGSSVMNPLSLDNDRQAYLGSMVVTPCDQQMARTYAFRSFP